MALTWKTLVCGELAPSSKKVVLPESFWMGSYKTLRQFCNVPIFQNVIKMNYLFNLIRIYNFFKCVFNCNVRTFWGFLCLCVILVNTIYKSI